MPDQTVDPVRGYPVYCSRTKWGKISPTVPLNYHIQSTAMWCMTRAMVRVQDYFNTMPGHFIVMQVHDELVLDLPKGGKKNMPTIRKVKKLMEQSGNDIGVPLKTSVSYHPETWATEVDIK